MRALPKIHLYIFRYLSNTPLQQLYYSGALNSSLWPVSHASDVLRYATLYKFGGLYLDLDVIVLKSMNNMSNYAGRILQCLSLSNLD